MVLLLLLAGCAGGSQDHTLVIASTTSTQDSGLFDRLNPVFEEMTGAEVVVVARGTGAALQYARDGNADLVFVHAPQAEEEFVREGYGVRRYPVMYNDFVILGPQEDPAGIGGMASAAEALGRIEEAGKAGKAVFVSRGDNSGTHKKEMSLWKTASITPAGSWYVSTGRGMGDTLTTAGELRGYTLSDRGTWLKRRDTLDGLAVLVEGPVKGGDPELVNPYGIIPVNPEYNPEVNYELAMAYVEFVTGPQGREIINSYRLNGEQLFFAAGE